MPDTPRQYENTKKRIHDLFNIAVPADAIHPTELGWSHENFVITHNGKSLFVKIFNEKASPEKSTPELAEITPNIFVRNQHGVVTEFVEGSHPTSSDFRKNKDCRYKIFSSIAKIQSVDGLACEHFDPIHDIETMTHSLSASANLKISSALSKLKGHKLYDSREIYNKRYMKYAHNDFNSSNLIITEDKCIVIDWEYPAYNHQLYDLAKLCSHYWLSDDECHEILQDFERFTKESYDVNHFFFMLAASDLWQATWLMLRHEEGRTEINFLDRALKRLEQFENRFNRGGNHLEFNAQPTTEINHDG